MIAVFDTNIVIDALNEFRGFQKEKEKRNGPN